MHLSPFTEVDKKESLLEVHVSTQWKNAKALTSKSQRRYRNNIFQIKKSTLTSRRE